MEKLKPVLKSLLVTVFIISSLTGVYRFVVFSGENKCEMTYMYEYPQYIKIPLEENGNNSYALYVYGEGELAERYQKTQFTGIPVLFVPGNSGSHKQVRSLASVAYRKHLDSRTKFHFDFFAVDFNEELTAVYGGHLEDQVRFVKTSISKILKLHNSSKQPTSVIIVGHSMGGMVAKGLFLENDFDKNSVRTVITLATPHRSPVVATDPYIVRFYEKVNHYWASPKNADVAFASVGGAVRDVQVRSGLTTAHDPAINVLTTAIPGVWLSTDHLCLVWCKQVVLTLTRALFDIVDPKTRQPREDSAFRENIFRYHLTNRFGGKHFQPSTVPREVKFDEEGEWREVIASQFVMDHNMNSGQIRNTYFMIPLLDNPHKNLLLAVAKRLGVRDWVFGCVASSWRGAVRICDKGINLSDQTVLLPSMGDNVKRKSLHMDLAKLKADGYSHLVFNLPRAEPKASVALDIHRSSDRDLVYRFSLLSYLNLFKPSVVARTPAGSLSYNLTFPDFTKSWQAFQILVEPLSSAKKCRAVIQKTVPWNRAESEFFLAVNRTVSVQAGIQLHAPKTLMDQEDQFLKLEIISVPGCEYSIL